MPALWVAILSWNEGPVNCSAGLEPGHTLCKRPCRPPMRTILHLSDIHMGRIDPALVATLTATIRTVMPDLVAISGDLTQRARETEFLQARRFIDALGRPVLVVPGNHDVP